MFILINKCKKKLKPYWTKFFIVKTKQETAALDEKLTRTTPRVDFNQPDIFIRQRELMNILKPSTADYIMTRALATHQTPAQIISEIVDEHIAAAM